MRRSIILALVFSGCALPEDWDGDGFSPLAGDCDDLDPTIHPYAEDIEDDGIDQDCSGADLFQRVKGDDHWCDLSSGQISCDGDNTHNQLDVPLGPDRRWIQLAAGKLHTCALDDSLNVSCWGDDTYGQSSPDIVGRYSSITAGPWSSAGYFENGGQNCWGLCFVEGED